MNQKTGNNCSKCGHNGFRQEVRQIQVQFGLYNELQAAGLATAIICEKCGAFQMPNQFNMAQQAWTLPQQDQSQAHPRAVVTPVQPTEAGGLQGPPLSPEEIAAQAQRENRKKASKKTAKKASKKKAKKASKKKASTRRRPKAKTR